MLTGMDMSTTTGEGVVTYCSWEKPVPGEYTLNADIFWQIQTGVEVVIRVDEGHILAEAHGCSTKVIPSMNNNLC